MAGFVEVVDARMGSGKSTEIIKWIDSNPQEKWLFVSPLLSEVEEGGRLMTALNHTVFVSPITSDDHDRKQDHLLELLASGANVACTHSLYLQMSDEHLDWIEKHGYILVIDEEINVVDGMSAYSYSDVRWLIDYGHITVQESDGMLMWQAGDNVGEKHKYKLMKQLCDAQSLYAAKRSESILVTQLPVRLISAAKRVVILTYMFKGNILDCFLRLKGIESKPFTEITVNEPDMADVQKLVTIVPVPRNFKLTGKLSGTWWKSASTADIKAVQNAIRSVCNATDAHPSKVMYTLPKSRFHQDGKQTVVNPRGYRQWKDQDGNINYCWLPCSIRATNDYAEKNVLIHAYRRHPLQSVNAYLQDYGQPIDIEVFALSELLQWTWRSAIRNGEPISICILSDKMLKLFQVWLAGEWK